VEQLASRLEMWDDAFPAAPPGQLRRRLLAQPQLLAVSVESTVPGLYEIAVLAGVQRGGWAAWAYKALPLALTRPAVVEARLRRALGLLNGGPGAARAALAAAGAAGADGPENAEEEELQAGVSVSTGAGLGGDSLEVTRYTDLRPPSVAVSDGSGSWHGSEGGIRRRAAAADASEAQLPASETSSGSGGAGGAAGATFTMVDVQKAAERDHRWLMLRETLVIERLEALQAALGVGGCLGAAHARVGLHQQISRHSTACLPFFGGRSAPGF
jgi:hypothetical protein